MKKQCSSPLRADPIVTGGNNENGRVAFPDSVRVHNKNKQLQCKTKAGKYNEALMLRGPYVFEYGIKWINGSLDIK